MKKLFSRKQPQLIRMFSATAILILVLSACLFAVSYGIRKDIKDNCFENLTATADEMAYELRSITDKDRQHLTSLANLIAKQEDIHSSLIVSVLKSFNFKEITGIGILYPDNRVLYADGNYADATGLLSFQEESVRGAHLSGKARAVLDEDRLLLRHFVPIVQNGTVVAMLYGVIDLPELPAFFQVNAYDGNAELFIVDGDTGEFLLDTWHNSLGSVDMLLSRKMTGGYKAEEVLSQIAAGVSGSFTFVSKTTNEVFYVHFQPSGINNWLVMLAVPEPVVMQQTEIPTQLLAGLAVVFVLAFTLYGIIIFRIYRRYMNLFVNTPAGLCVLSRDKDLSIITANREFYRIMMCEYKSRLGRQESLIGLLRAEDKAAVAEKYKEIVTKKTKSSDIEYRITDSLGEKHSILAAVYYDMHGSGRITASIMDITQRKQLQQQMHLLEQEYQAAIQLSERYVAMYDIPSRTVQEIPGLADLSHIFGISGDFIAEDAAKEFVEKDSLAELHALFGAIHGGEKTGGVYLRLRNKSAAQPRWVRLEFANIFSDSGMPIRAILSLYDATEQHENELAYTRLQQSGSELPAAMYKSYERNLTRNTVESENGEAFESPEAMLVGGTQRDIDLLISKRVVPEYQKELCRFCDRERLMDMYQHGTTSDQTEIQIRSQSGKARWFMARVQLVSDSFTGELKAYHLFENIDDAKGAELKRNRELKQLKSELENSRIRIMMSQMQPHFLYNALSSIQTIVKRDPDYAYRLIYDFTVHLRSSIKALQSDEPIAFAEELKNIKAYLNIEKMRFGDKLRVNYEIACKDFMLIPLSIQPLVENAVKHGRRAEGGSVSLRSYETEEAWLVEVEDDGEGFAVEQELKRNSDSVGLKNVLFRLKALMNAQVDITSIQGDGTKVTVRIPKKEERTHENDTG